MTSLLRKSRYLISFYVMIALFSTLSFSVILSMYERAGRLHDGISQDGILVRLGSSYSDSDMTLTVDDFINVLKDINNTDFLLYRNENHEAQAFYLWNRELPFMVEWLQVENIEKMNSVIIDELLLPNARYEAGHHYIWYHGHDYQIIGTFQRDEIMGGSLFFFPIDLENPLLGQYVIDGLSIEDISISVQQLQDVNSNLTVEFMSLEQTFFDRMLIVIQVSFFVFVALLLAIIFIGFGVMTHTIAWLELRRNEIDVRYLVGATTKHIQEWLLKEYVFIISCSFILGSIIAFLIWKIGLFDIIMPEFHLLGIGISFVLSLILGLLTKGISTQLNDRNKSVLRKGKV